MNVKAALLKKAADPFAHLFWKAQINVLRACPPLVGAIARFSMSADRSRGNWVKALLRVVVQAPRAAMLHWRDIKNKRVVLPRVSISLTTRCTLHCDKCMAHIPDLKSHKDIPLDDLAQDIRSLFSCVDYIYSLSLTGGEAFLHPALDEIIRTCAAADKIGGMEVITNGTVVPDTKALAALREAGVTVKISGYPPALVPNAEKLKAVLKENGIHYIHTDGTFWRDIVGRGFGRLEDGSETKRFGVCVQQLCVFLFYGKLHLCSESANLLEEELIPDCKEDYIDLRKIDPAAFRGAWRQLMKKRAVSACSYCPGSTYKTPKVPVAIQRVPPGDPQREREVN